VAEAESVTKGWADGIKKAPARGALRDYEISSLWGVGWAARHLYMGDAAAEALHQAHGFAHARKGNIHDCIGGTTEVIIV
jgi:hypothetical protein